MSRVTAIHCDWPDCHEVSTEERAEANGWLSVGGRRRGRYRADLCSYHALRVTKELLGLLGDGKKKIK